MKKNKRIQIDLFLFQDEINIVNSDAFQKTIRWVKNNIEKDNKIYIFILLAEYSSMAYRSITSKITSNK